MSEQLKSFRIKEVEDGCPFWQAEYEVYSKSEVDKLIAELNIRICEGDEDFEIANNQIKRLLKIVRHQKHKRCLAMAEMCMLKSRISYFEKKSNKSRRMSKWCKRWHELAKNFNPDNSTAQ